MIDETIPSVEETDHIAEALLPGVLDRIERQERVHKHRRRLLAWGTPAAIVVTGSVVAAAFFSPVLNPGTGQLGVNGKQVNAVFALECVSSTDSTEQQYTDQSLANVAIKDPVATCDQLLTDLRRSDLVNDEAQRLMRTGLTCGTIEVPGERRWQWQTLETSDGKPAWSVGNGSSLEWPAICDESKVTIGLPTTTDMGATAICATASNWLSVYSRSTKSAAAVCSLHSQQPWAE